MKSLVCFICFLILTCITESRRQEFSKSRRARPRGSRHHIFKNANPPRIQNNSKTTKVTKIVTVNGNGQENVKQFNNQDAFIDYQMGHRNPNWKQQNHYNPPQNAFQDPNFPNPSIHNYYPPSPNQHSTYNIHPPNPEQHCNFETSCEMSLKPWLIPKYKEYTTKCCTKINITSTDQSNGIEKGNQINVLFWRVLSQLHKTVCISDALGIYNFDRYYAAITRVLNCSLYALICF